MQINVNILKPLVVLALIINNSIYCQIPNTLSKAEKIYGLSKLWQEVNYNFIYLNKIDRDKWDEDYKQLLIEVQKSDNDYDYYRLLQRFCASLKDGHTNVYLPKSIQDELYYTHFGEYRIFISNIDEKAIVTRVNLSKKDEIPIGSEVIKVNGETTDDFLKNNIMPYLSSSTDYILEDMATWRMLQGLKGSTFDIELRLPNGDLKKLNLTHAETKEKEVFPEFEDYSLLNFEWIEKEIAYVALNSFEDTMINSLFEEKLDEMYKAKALILDLRNNGGGYTNIGMDILKYLTKDTILYGSKAQSRLHIPSYKAWGKYTKANDTINDHGQSRNFSHTGMNSYMIFPMNRIRSV